MIVTIERTRLGVQVRITPCSQKEGPLRPGVCVYCARAAGQKDCLCKGSTKDCEQRVWLASRRLRGEA